MTRETCCSGSGRDKHANEEGPMEALKNVAWGLLCIAIIIAMVFVAALLINGMAWVSGYVLE
jgi:hypothetical protein